MARSHRVRPGRRRSAEIGYRVDVWRSVAVLITNNPPLPAPARRLLAASLIEIFGQGEVPGFQFPARTPDEFIATLQELHQACFLGIEDGVAFMAYPDRDALGRKTAQRVPSEQMGEMVEAFRQSLAEDGEGDTP